MKRSVRMLFSIFFGFSVTALCFLIYYYPGSSQGQFVSSTQKPFPVFNTALLTFAAFDLADYSLGREVEQLLGGDFGSSIDKHNWHHLELGSPEFNRLRLESKRYLREWWDQRQFNSEVMLNTVRLLDYRRKYKTCAVVGNSGVLLQSNHGEAIDSHEFVIRINNAKVIGFDRFVGSKTNISFTYTDVLNLCSDEKGCYCHPYGKQVPTVMYISQPAHFLDYVFCNSLHKGLLMITDPQFDVLCARIGKYYSVKRFVKESGKSFEAWSGTHWGSKFRYSSGMQAVMLALGVCENVSVFGFGKSDSAKHHYHDNLKNETSLHHYEAEYDLYEDLVKSPENVPFVSNKFKFPPVIMYK